MIRQPVVAFVGHVDHGKSSLLQHVANLSITKGEAGGITQIIKAYTVGMQEIKKFCGHLFEATKQNITLPGILFIDTPGHAAFTSLRKRGGNLADIAILVVDINEGIKPQTLEAIEILKSYKTPFVVALNKIDNIQGWNSQPDKNLMANITSQGQATQQLLDNKLYEILGVLHEKGVPSERFDRVQDFTKSVGMIPVSAKTGEGIPELLMIVSGLCQKFLEESLKIEVTGPAKGTVLEVVEVKGFGTVLDIIIYDGKIKVNDQIIIGGVNEPIVTKIRGLRAQGKKKIESIKEATAASALQIIAPGIKEAASGMPVQVIDSNLEELKEKIHEEIEEAFIETDEEGITLKADSLGSLEALTHLLKEKDIPIAHASIGSVTKKDLANAVAAKKDENKVILAFNVEGEIDEKVHIIKSNIIYKILDDYEEWKQATLKSVENKELEGITRPGKVQFLPHYVFRQSNPAIIGARIILGNIRVGMPLMNAEGKDLTVVKEIQKDKENVKEAGAGDEVALSLPGVTVGRQINEGDIFYSRIIESEFVKLKKLKSFLKPGEVEILKEIAEIMRRDNKLWGI